MSRPLVQYGSNGPNVEECQELLNRWSKKEYGQHGPQLAVDGDFGSKTRDLAKQFQVNVFLYKDGKVGKRTWAALLGTEMYNCYDLPLPFVAAPDQYRCWAGATAMLLGKGSAVTRQPAGVKFEQLPNGQTGGLENSHANMKKYAKAHGMAMLQGQHMSCLQIVNLLDQFGRLMLNMRGVNSNMNTASPNDSHLLNLVGARGDGQAGGTTITLYNPSAVGFGGQVIVHGYSYLKNRYPGMTYQVFYTYNKSSKRVY